MERFNGGHLAAATAALAVLAAPVAVRAEPAIVGLYRLEAEGMPPGCAEFWTFAADGGLTVESGQEVVRFRWRVERGERDTWLVLEQRIGNGRPDCQGKVATDDPGRSARTSVNLLTTGDIGLCEANRVVAGAACMGKCHGWLRRVVATRPPER